MIHSPKITKRTRTLHGEKVIDYRVSLGTHAGKKIVFFRQTRAEAKDVGNATYARYAKQGDAGIIFSAEQVADAIAAFGILEKHIADITLTELARQHVANSRRGVGKATFGKLLDAYLNGLSSGLSATYRRSIRHYAKQFETRIGRDVLCDTLTQSDVKPILDEMGEGSPKSWNNVRGALNTIFAWGMEEGIIHSTPVASIAKKIEVYAEPVFFKAQQVAQILEEGAKTKDAALYMPWLILGFFCGIRSAEIGRLNWEAVKWEQNIIRIEKPKGSTRGSKPRFVTLNETAGAWLAPYRQNSGSFADYLKFCRWRNSLKNYPPESDNAMRHTFATMHYAMYENLPKTAKEMGHGKNADTTLEHYCGLATNGEATAFWALRSAPVAGYDGRRDP